jgi:hypothetical protein
MAIFGLILLGAIGLFPPLKRPPDLPAGAQGVLGPRAFLLAGEYWYFTNVGGQQVGKIGAEIDPSRLLAEGFVSLALAGIGFVVLWQPGAKPA